MLDQAARDIGAQIILVSREFGPAISTFAEQSGAEVVIAPTGSTRAEMCDLGMSRAGGAIVAVRDAAEVGDARWMDAYRTILPSRERVVPPAVGETLMMDTLVAGSAAPVADGVPPMVEARFRLAAVEMAAAI